MMLAYPLVNFFRLKFFSEICLLTIASCVFLTPSQVFAHHEGTISGPGIAGPIITLPARTLPKGKAFISSGLKYTHFDNFGMNKVQSLLARRETTGQIDDSLVVNIGGGYGITGDLDIYFSIPYQFKYNLIETDSGERTNFGDSIGLGDLTLLSQYRFYKNEEHGFYASLIGGLNVPIGEVGKETNQGDKFGLDDQPGSGSWDPIFGAALSKNLGPVSLDSNFLYRLSTQGPRDSVTGDTINYNVALSYRVDRHRHLQHSHGKLGTHSHSTLDHNPLHTHSHNLDYHQHQHEHKNGHEHIYSHNYSAVGDFLAKLFPEKVLGQDVVWDLITELNYNWQERPEVNDIEEENHGGHIIFSTQGLRATFNERFVTNLGVQLPLIKGYNGAQADPDVSVLFSMSLLL